MTETGVPEATPATPTRRDDFNLDQATPGFTQQAQPFAGVTPVAAPREQTGQVSAAMPRPAPRALEAQVVAQQKAQEAKLTERNRALGLDPNFDFAQFAPPPKAVAQSLANPITTPPPKNAVEFAAQMVARAGKKLGKSAIDFAARMLGKGEKPNRAQLNNFMKEAGINIDVMTTAWCAAYVNAALEYAGKTGTGKLNARSFMSWGRATTNPQPGDIAVYSRGNPKGWQGHVGLVTGTDPRGRVSVISGNTSGPGLGKGGVADKVMSTGRLLGYRTDRP